MKAKRKLWALLALTGSIAPVVLVACNPTQPGETESERLAREASETEVWTAEIVKIYAEYRSNSANGKEWIKVKTKDSSLLKHVLELIAKDEEIFLELDSFIQVYIATLKNCFSWASVIQKNKDWLLLAEGMEEAYLQYYQLVLNEEEQQEFMQLSNEYAKLPNAKRLEDTKNQFVKLLNDIAKQRGSAGYIFDI